MNHYNHPHGTSTSQSLNPIHTYFPMHFISLFAYISLIHFIILNCWILLSAELLLDQNYSELLLYKTSVQLYLHFILVVSISKVFDILEGVFTIINFIYCWRWVLRWFYFIFLHFLYLFMKVMDIRILIIYLKLCLFTFFVMVKDWLTQK